MTNSNNIPDPDNLQPGMQLRVLPVPGMEYKVQKGDTIRAIADRLGVTPQMILDSGENVGANRLVADCAFGPGGAFGSNLYLAVADTLAPTGPVRGSGTIAIMDTSGMLTTFASGLDDPSSLVFGRTQEAAR